MLTTGIVAILHCVPRIRGAHDAHALTPLTTADGARFLARPVFGLGGRIEEGRGRTEELLFLVSLEAALFLKVGDAGGDVDVGVWGGVDFFEEGLELVFFEGLDEVEKVLDRRAGTRACLGCHCFVLYLFICLLDLVVCVCVCVTDGKRGDQFPEKERFKGAWVILYFCFCVVHCRDRVSLMASQGWLK